jgi:metal-responsive CopG/Arc/MetJ family transcriptional regulator
MQKQENSVKKSVPVMKVNTNLPTDLVAQVDEFAAASVRDRTGAVHVLIRRGLEAIAEDKKRAS